VVRVPLATAIGLGLGGLVLFALALLGQLNATIVVVGAAALVVSLLISDRQRLQEEAHRLTTWLPATPTWLETVVLGIAVGVVTFALLAVFIPETISDAILEHLPVAQGIWQTGSVAVFPLLNTSHEPVAGHLLYAVAFGIGGLPATQMVQAGVGLTAVAAVAGIAWLGAGRVAAVAGAAIFAGMPLTLWLLGHAFLDLFPVLFTVNSVLALLLWQRDGHPGWLICAGMLAGSGAAAKLPTMTLMIVAIICALVVVGRRPGHWRERVFGVALFVLSVVVVIMPWVLRSTTISGGLSRLDPVVKRLGVVLPQGFLADGPVEAGGPAGIRPSLNPPVMAPDHSLLGLIRFPWDLTFNTTRFGFPIIRLGEVGLTWLMLFPLLVIAPRTRMMAFLSVTAGVGLLGWWLTPLQVTRHVLPALAIVAAMIGIAFASAIATPMGRARRVLATVSRAGLIASGVAALVFFLHGKLVTVPIDLLTGQQSAAEYVTEHLPVAAALESAAADIPTGSLVAYIGRHTQAPQLYTDAQLVIFEDPAVLGATPQEVLTNHNRFGGDFKLDQVGIDFLVWNRDRAPHGDPAYWQSAILSTPFLRDHTRIIAGDDQAYVFALLPESGTAWGVDTPHNLLRDPDLDTAGGNGPWSREGTVRARRGIVTMRDQTSSLAQQVEVTPGKPYLLTATAICNVSGDPAILSLRWLDSSGQVLDVAQDVVFPGDAGSEQFIWRRAPTQAAVVSAEVASTGCRFDTLALYELT
jgi:hypothetical protein